MTPVGSRSALIVQRTLMRRRRRGRAGAGPAQRSRRAVEEQEDGMLGSDPAQLLLARARPDAFEEDADLGLPPAQVRAQDRRLLALVDDLDGPEGLRAATETQAPLPARAQVARPLGVAPRGQEIALPFVAEQVDRRAPPLAGAASAHLEHARAPHAQPEPRQRGDGAVEDVLGQPAGAPEVALRLGLHVRLRDPAQLTRNCEEGLIAAYVAPRARLSLRSLLGLLEAGARVSEPRLERGAVELVGRDRLLDQQQ